MLCENPLGVDGQECIMVAEKVEKAGITYTLGRSKYKKTHLKV